LTLGFDSIYVTCTDSHTSVRPVVTCSEKREPHPDIAQPLSCTEVLSEAAWRPSASVQPSTNNCFRRQPTCSTFCV